MAKATAEAMMEATVEVTVEATMELMEDTTINQKIASYGNGRESEGSAAVIAAMKTTARVRVGATWQQQ